MTTAGKFGKICRSVSSIQIHLNTILRWNPSIFMETTLRISIATHSSTTGRFGMSTFTGTRSRRFTRTYSRIIQRWKQSRFSGIQLDASLECQRMLELTSSSPFGAPVLLAAPRIAPELLITTIPPKSACPARVAPTTEALEPPHATFQLQRALRRCPPVATALARRYLLLEHLAINPMMTVTSPNEIIYGTSTRPGCRLAGLCLKLVSLCRFLGELFCDHFVNHHVLPSGAEGEEMTLYRPA